MALTVNKATNWTAIVQIIIGAIFQVLAALGIIDNEFADKGTIVCMSIATLIIGWFTGKSPTGTPLK